MVARGPPKTEVACSSHVLVVCVFATFGCGGLEQKEVR
jgi:hypothetical protein